MRSSYGKKGTRSVLALLVTVALAFGLVPVGAFAFAATQTGASTEFASVDDMAADKGDAPDTEKKDVQAQGQGSAKTETTDSAQQQGAQQDEEATEPGNGTQAQEEQPGEQTLMVMSTSTANATGQEQTESEDPSDGDTQLYAQATTLSSVAFTVTPPEAGTTSATAPTVTVGADANYVVDNKGWVTVGGGSLGNVTFNAGEKYYIWVTIAPKSNGYTFDSTVTSTCEGGTVVSSYTNLDKTIDGVSVKCFQARVEVTATAPAADVVTIKYDVNGGTKGSAWPAGDLYESVKSGTLMRFTAPTELAASFATPPQGMKYAGYQIGVWTVLPGEESGYINVQSDTVIKLRWVSSDTDLPVRCGFAKSGSGKAEMNFTNGITGEPDYMSYAGKDDQPTPGSASVKYGTKVTMTATPGANYSLKGWYSCDSETGEVGALVSTAATYEYTAIEPTYLKAVFEHVHTPGAAVHENEVAATCTTGGSYDEVVYCTECEAEISRTAKTIAALGHDWGEWVETDGKAMRTCKRDASHTETVDVAYATVSGDGATWEKGSSDPLTFTFKRNVNDGKTFKAYKSAKVDGVDVPESAIATAEGSLILSMTTTYLETLSVGEHELTVAFEDGEATATFTVKAAETKAVATSSSSSKPTSPKTGDPMPVTLLAVSATLSAAVLLAARARTRQPLRATGKHARR